VAAVVLAAGAGTRFGGGKLLARLDSRPILQHVLDRLADVPLADVVVIVGDDADAASERTSANSAMQPASANSTSARCCHGSHRRRLPACSI
jgi:CTP:molybdopterin cytidylyltransferase MocA